VSLARLPSQLGSTSVTATLPDHHVRVRPRWPARTRATRTEWGAATAGQTRGWSRMARPGDGRARSVPHLAGRSVPHLAGAPILRPCARCSGFQLQLERSQRANDATARANAAAQAKRDEYEALLRAAQKKLDVQACSLCSAAAASTAAAVAAAATIAQLQQQVAAQEEALRRSAGDAMSATDDNLRLSTQLRACESRERGLREQMLREQMLLREQVAGMERGLREQVVELQQQVVQATADLIDERQAHRLLHDELAESERSLGGAALFWAACYDQAFSVVDTGALDARAVRGETLSRCSSHGVCCNGSGSFSNTSSTQQFQPLRPHILSPSLHSSDSGEEW
jgi:hypothetical protein